MGHQLVLRCRIFNIYRIFSRGNIFAGSFFFFFSGENINSELPVLDVCDISTTDIGESFVLQEHVQSAFFWEADEQWGHFVDFLPQLLSAICLTLQQKQLY